MMPSTPRLRLAVLLLAATLACADGGGPGFFDAAFTLTAINGSPPPVLVGATSNCDEYLDSAHLDLLEDGTFALTAQTTLDCTAAGGTVSPQLLTITGTYTRGGATITLQVPGATPIPATYDGRSLTGTIPASPATFPVALDVVFSQIPPL